MIIILIFLYVTETWLDNNIDDSEVAVEGYNLCIINSKNENHGGIVCYVKSRFKLLCQK